jgi:hypothetical protein
VFGGVVRFPSECLDCDRFSTSMKEFLGFIRFKSC